MALGWWVSVPTARRLTAVTAIATAAAGVPTLIATPVITAPAAAASAAAYPPVFSTPPIAIINAVAATATSRMVTPTPTVAPVMDTFIDFETMPNGSITTPGWVTTQIGTGSALPTISGGRMVQNSTGTAAAAAYLTKPLSDSARIIHVRTAFEIVSNTTTATAAVVFWQYFMNQGSYDGHLQRSSDHIVFQRAGYVVQKYSTAEGGGTNLYQVSYPSPPGGAVQQITITLDVAAQALTIVGGDGVTRRHPGIGGNNLLTDWPGLYACAEIYDGNPSVDDTRFLYFGADSIVRAAAYVPPVVGTAIAAGVAPAIAAGSALTGVAATASAAAPAPVISGATATVNAVVATATAAASVPSVSTGDATITAVAATATADAPVPAPSGGSSLTAVAATATAAATAPTISVKASYSDPFTRANAATLGASWTGRTSTVLKVDTNVAVPDTLSSFCLDSYNSAMFTDDHKVTAVVTATSGLEGTLLYIRSNNSDSQIYAYMLNSGQWLIYSHTSTYNGSLSSPTQRAITPASQSYTTGDSLSFEATGNVYTIRKNGTSILTWTDSGNAVPTGSTHREVAICYYASAASHGIDSFTAVDL